MLRRQHLLSATVKLKLRWGCRLHHVDANEMTLPQPSDDAAEINATACILLERAVAATGGAADRRRRERTERSAASLVVGATECAENLYTAVKEVRKRYGESALRRASDLDDHAAAIDEKS